MKVFNDVKQRLFEQDITKTTEEIERLNPQQAAAFQILYKVMMKVVKQHSVGDQVAVEEIDGPVVQ